MFGPLRRAAFFDTGGGGWRARLRKRRTAPEGAAEIAAMPTESFWKTFLRCQLALLVAPLAATALLLWFPVTTLLGLIPAFVLSAPACLVIGGPDFSPEFCLPVTSAGYAWTAATWFAVATVAALVRAAWARLRHPR